MNIIIVGGGTIGFALAKKLTYEKHDITLIENSPERYNFLIQQLDASVVLGSGTSPSVLEEAGIRNADMMVAITNVDEVNLLASIAAKKYGVQKTVARVKNREFLSTKSPINAQAFKIDLLIHPESIVAQGTIKLLKQSAASDIIEFAHGRIILIGIHLDKTSPILKIPLKQLAAQYDDFPFRIVAIQRKEFTKIPRGDDILMPNDRIFVVMSRENTPRFIEITGKHNTPLDRIMILGGGQTGFLIAKALEKEHNVKIVESNIDKSHALAEKLKRSLIVKGDGRDINLLALEGIIEMDAFLAMTGDDETNIISCLLAKHLQVPRIICLINKPDYSPIIPTIGIDAFISKQALLVTGILKFIRRGNVISVASIPGVEAEAIELVANKNSKIIKKPLAKLSFPQNAIIGAVMRGEQVFIPTGNLQLQEGDKAVLFCLPGAIRKVESLFK